MARLVFDTGSTLSFVRKGLCEQIGAKLIGHAETSVGRFGDQKGYNAKYPVKQVQLQLRNGSTMQMRLRETNAVSTPIRLVPVDRSEFPCEITTSDWAEMLVTETTAAEIDILVGLDYYYDIVGPEQWRGTSGLVVKQTAVGKIVTGFLKDTDSRQEQNQLLVVEQARETSHLFDIERFWRLEDIGVKDSPGLKDDEVALEQFKSTVRVTNMRYEVQWPFKTEKPELPTNYSVALRRLNSVYKKLDKDHSLADKYNSIFVEQLDKGIIEEAPEEPDGVVHYLPHHAVITPGKETTKVRVVFDASSKEKADALSLNDAMHRGPVFLNNMVGMQLRFRLSKVAITSDVEKAFLQISLQRHHRDCTRFLWLKDHAKPPTPTNIVVYRYARVAFGMKASPFLLAATIIHHMLIVGTPTALEVKDNTYMDNSFGGRDNTADAKQYYAEAKQLFRQISMNLREWYSNDKEFISSLPVADQGKSSCPSVLGLRWNTDRDTVHCPTAAVPTEAQHATKRQILKDLASAFDPCGWFSGITVRAKMIMQELWREKTGWDEKVGQEVLARWQTIQRDLAEISQVELPRQLERPHGLAPQYQAHVFCDASSRAYAAAVYLRASTEQGTTSDVIFAKSRIAPMKELTIPQLELMATLLGVRTINFVTEQLKLPLQQRFLWTDSMCVLGWLQSDKVVGVFVDNRLREIRSSPDIAFGHVRTEENPADIPSRGVDLIDLKASQLWWKGPKWLVQGEAAWPLQPSTYVPKLPPEPAELVHRLQADETERRKNTEIVDSLWDLKRFSSLTQLLRSTSYVFRAVNRMRHKQRPASELLLAHEITHARCFWEKRVQEEGFPVSDDKSWKNNVRQMGLFRDDAGFWRCGGRYANTSLLSEAQNPKLLPTNHHFTTLTIKRCHAAAMHSGVKGTLAIIRQTYWISQGRRAVKSVISKCQLCRKHFGGPFARPEEPPLPDFRGKLTRPFAAVGIDYLGPLTVRVEKDNRKVWVALFTCAAVRAVHLELVDSLTASDFLLSLRRFMALYGKPDLIVSDNAKHFVTSNQVFDKLWQEIQESPTVVDFAATREISWKFITEKAPWFGGFYERLVKSVKHALKASLGSWTLTPDEFRTLLYEVAFVLNGRPLTYADDDPGDVVLTPAHLLFRARDMFPETTGEVDPVRQRSMAGMMVMHWRAGQNLLREFWDIWRKDYLLALRETWRTRKERGVSDIAVDVGAVVLIKEPLPRGMWRVGRITKVRPSSDGKVRTAEVRLPTGSTLARPVTLLYPIEAAGPHDEATVPGEPSAALAAQPMDSVAPSSRPVMYIVEIPANHPLHYAHCYANKLRVHDKRFTSIFHAFNYVTLLQNGFPKEAEDLLTDPAMMWSADRQGAFMAKVLQSPNVQLLIRSMEVVKSIVVDQVLSPGTGITRSAFSEYLEGEFQNARAANQDEVEFRVYTKTDTDRVWTSGNVYGKWKIHPDGFNEWGKILVEASKLFADGTEPVPPIPVSELFTNLDLFKPNVRKSLLLVSDSQARRIKTIKHGTVVPVSGGTYGHMANALKRHNLAEYKYVAVYVGTNCPPKASYPAPQRDHEWGRLREILIAEAARRGAPEVLFCLSFDQPGVRSNNAHAEIVRQQLENTGVILLDWSEFGNPFLDGNGRKKTEYFDVAGKGGAAREREIHLGKFGLQVLWGELCMRLNGLQFVRYTLLPEPDSVAKGLFDSPPETEDAPGPSWSGGGLRVTTDGVRSEVRFAPPKDEKRGRKREADRRDQSHEEKYRSKRNYDSHKRY